VLAGWLEAEGPSRRSLAGLFLLLPFFAVPVAFAFANFSRNEVLDRRTVAGRPSDTGLLTPELSSRSAPEASAAIASLLRSPRDLVVLAGPAGWGSGFLMWLEIPYRTLPIGTFFAPLGARYLDAADLKGTGELRSSLPLRVVLVVSRGTLEAGWLPRLQRRFPQARAWQIADVPAETAVEIWYADLEVP
jgi:hypothetical protein